MRYGKERYTKASDIILYLTHLKTAVRLYDRGSKAYRFIQLMGVNFT
ncbi:hypothetical protein [Stenomitos frigidus]|nr:hypothetical protein [Stenomitos frigidus]